MEEQRPHRTVALIVAAVVALTVVGGGLAWKARHDGAREQCRTANNLRTALGTGARDC